MESERRLSSTDWWDFLRPKKGVPRLFKSYLIENFSKIPPYLPHIVYIPLVLYMMYITYIRSIGFLYGISLFISGIFSWTLFEYLLHRFVFHIDPRGNKIVERFVYIMHGNHHEYPWDYLRLVMPLSVSIPLAVLFWYFFEFIFGYYFPPFYAGFVLGYLLYDTSHFLVHYDRFNPRSKIFNYLRKHHLRHHFLTYDGNFGVSSPIWDFVFGTFVGRREFRGDEEEVFD